MSHSYKIVLAIGLAAFVSACAVPEQEPAPVVVQPVQPEPVSEKY